MNLARAVSNQLKANKPTLNGLAFSVLLVNLLSFNMSQWAELLLLS